MPPALAPAFELTCLCGARLRGHRMTRHQVVPCPGCNEPRFILPLSPLPSPPAGTTILEAPSGHRTPWVMIGISVAVIAVVIGIIVALSQRGPKPDQVVEAPPTQEQLQASIAEGKTALGEGAYLRAARKFESALAIGDAVERRRVAQLHRQAALLGDLLAESPAEIVRHAVGVPEAEWQEIFRRRYAGQALLLDDTISRGADGRYQTKFRILAAGSEARLELNALRLLNDLPMAQPQRVLLGLRLAALRRDNAGWTFTPQADSGVLLTDPEVFAGLSLAPDAELREVLKRQRTWLDLP